MKVLIDIPEDVIECAKSSPNYYPTYHFEKIWRAIVNGTALPQNATNGDVIMATFPDADYEIGKRFVHITNINSIGELSIPLDWWNAPYKAGEDKE